MGLYATVGQYKGPHVCIPLILILGGFIRICSVNMGGIFLEYLDSITAFILSYSCIKAHYTVQIFQKVLEDKCL